ncbi:MAG: penicillin acylase family protein [Desulfobacterales bacterium]|jgi:penicillin amidase
MKRSYKIMFMSLVLVVLLLAGGFIYLRQLKPQYSGEVVLEGLHQKVNVFFDPWAVPHIVAQNENDAYFALGYLHAQERLFQMEILRRIAAGRMAEIFGKKLVKTDRFFRTIGIGHSARQSAEKFFGESSQPYQKAGRAYLAGINQYLEKGKTPIEFSILRIPKEKFTPQDFYLVAGFLAFGFSQGFRTDPLVAKVHKEFGWPYLKDWVLGWSAGARKIPVHRSNFSTSAAALSATIMSIIDGLPAVAWIGSNGWVLSGKKTTSGNVLLANDTHILFTQPSVWYEAHIAYPGASFHGFHAAGIPFGLVGRNRSLAWGLTMLHNDDVDFFREKANPHNPDQVWVDDHWENLEIRTETIRVRFAEDVTFKIRISRHGPLLNSVDDTVAAAATDPISLWWTLNQFPTTSMQAAYLFSRAQNINDMRRAAALIDAPGLNIMYGDKEGNIAWWAAARLVKRPAHVNSKLFLDGASGKDEPLGYYDFSDNPQAENPPSGFVYSANNQPESAKDKLYPGYYVPDHRARRIVDLLESDTVWSVEAVRKMGTDCISPATPEMTREIIDTLYGEEPVTPTPLMEEAKRILMHWNGEHQIDDVAPTIFYKLLAHIAEDTLADELGADDYQTFMSTHLMKRTLPVLLQNDSSLWWDNIHTRDIKETRKMIFARSFERTLQDLKKQLGPAISDWHWGKVHTLEHQHLLGRKKPLHKLFNVGPFSVPGGDEVIANMAFRLTTEGRYPVLYGPAMRFIVDFSGGGATRAVNPTGQSGFFLSRHYDDQTALFNSGKLRPLEMNAARFRENHMGRLILRPH